MQEFVLSHTDNVEASGFVQHLKLPHYVDFQAELELVRKMRASRRRDAPATGDRRMQTIRTTTSPTSTSAPSA